VSRRGGRRERGAAALELTLFMVLLFALIALMAPLGLALLTKNRLERAAGSATRFATQVPDHRRPGTDVRKPTPDEICNDAIVNFRNAGGSATATVGCTVTVNNVQVTGADNARRPGADVAVHLTVTADLGAFGGILSAAGLGSQNIDLSATSLAHQE
jgi:Flp pilus assembly protein TadG